MIVPLLYVLSYFPILWNTNMLLNIIILLILQKDYSLWDDLTALQVILALMGVQAWFFEKHDLAVGIKGEGQDTS